MYHKQQKNHEDYTRLIHVKNDPSQNKMETYLKDWKMLTAFTVFSSHWNVVQILKQNKDPFRKINTHKCLEIIYDQRLVLRNFSIPKEYDKGRIIGSIQRNNNVKP